MYWKRAKLKFAEHQMVQHSLSDPRNIPLGKTRTVEGNVVLSVRIAQGMDIKEKTMKNGSDNCNTCKSEGYLGVSMQPSEEKLKNKIELWDDLVICECGKALTSVFWCGQSMSHIKRLDLGSSMLHPLAHGNDLDEYKGIHQGQLGSRK